jgi:transcription-repair coupling factor (superfamily II helicase)
MLFSGLHTKLQYWKDHQQLIQLKGISPNQWCLLAGSYFQDQVFSGPHVLICSDQDEAEEVYEALKHFKNIHFYPGHNHSLYSSILTSESSLLARWSVLQRLVQGEKIIVVTTWEAALMLGPDPLFFKENSFTLKKDDIIAPLDLANRLTEMGYFPSSTIEEPGTFSRRGEIFDIYPVAHPPIRLHYFDDLIEEIFGVELETQKTDREKTYQEVCFVPGAGFLTRDPYANNLRSKLPQPQPRFKNRYEVRKQIFQKMSEGQLFDNYPLFIPLFFEKPQTLMDYLPQDSKLTFFNTDNGQKTFDLFLAQQIEDQEALQDNVESSSIIPAPDAFYQKDFKPNQFKTIQIDQLDISLSLDDHLDRELHLNLVKLKSHIQIKLQMAGEAPENKFEYIKASLKVLKNELKSYGHLIVTYKSENARQELTYLLEENGLRA